MVKKKIKLSNDLQRTTLWNHLQTEFAQEDIDIMLIESSNLNGFSFKNMNYTRLEDTMFFS